MRKILRISLSAALVSARLSGSAEAAYEPEDFDQIETLIEDGNWVALRGYLNSNPRILDCNDQLASELRRFLEDASGLYAALTFEDSMFPDMELRQFVPDDCVVVASNPPASDNTDSQAASRPPAPVSSRAASPRNDDARAPLSRAAAAPSIY